MEIDFLSENGILVTTYFFLILFIPYRDAPTH